MKRVPKKSGVVLEQLSPERRKELKNNPSLAESLEEEIWITRSRLSSLNGVVNAILAIDNGKRDLKSTAANLCWGVFGIQLTAKNQSTATINRNNIENSIVIEAMLNSIPSQDYHRINQDEETGFYWGFAARNGHLLAGLPRAKKSEAYVALLAAFAIHGLNEKLQSQLAKASQAQNGPLSDRAHMLARLAGRVPFEELEE